MPAGKYGTTKGNTPETTCCSDKTKCGSKTCSGMWKDKTGKPTIVCDGADAGICTNEKCCDKKETTCGGIGGVTCMSPYFYDEAKNSLTVTAKSKNYRCCQGPETCEGSNEAVQQIETCPVDSGGASGGSSGGASGGSSSGSRGSGTSSGSPRLVPTFFATFWVMMALAWLK